MGRKQSLLLHVGVSRLPVEEGISESKPPGNVSLAEQGLSHPPRQDNDGSWDRSSGAPGPYGPQHFGATSPGVHLPVEHGNIPRLAPAAQRSIGANPS